jgi:SRSO17 transposase
MATRVQPNNVRSAHQSMHHLVAQARWSDTALLAATADEVLPVLLDAEQPCVWIVDDSGFPKKGRHSVGVARQYCGQTGKTDNCQVAVTLSLANSRGSLPVAARLYLPREWTDDPTRCRDAGVPAEIEFATKGQIALTQIASAVQAGYPHGTVLADAAYGDDTAWREQLSEWGLIYAVGIKPATTVWWGSHQPVIEPARRRSRRGELRMLAKRDEEHQAIAVSALARELPAGSYRTVTWREGVAQPLRSRLARVRVRAANGDRLRPEEWLIIEWPHGEAEPTHYWLSTLPADTAWQPLVDTLKARWRIERDYQELKQELGWGHYEGRNWRGFHHHASLCIAAYGFLMLERLAGAKKNSARFETPPLPKDFRPRGAGSDASSRSVVDRDVSLPPGSRYRAKARSVSLLRTQAPRSRRTETLITQ